MYIPDHFNQPDKKTSIAFIKDNNFGQLTSMLQSSLCVSHLPFMINDEGTSLLTHLARENPQWRTIENQEVLVTFQGAHGYISPSWYSAPGVPTWNYQAVHVYGQCRLIESFYELKHIVESLSEYHERQFSEPWQAEYNENLLKGIVGLEITVKDMQCKFKLSQNRSLQDRKQVISALEEQGKDALVVAMKQQELIKQQ